MTVAPFVITGRGVHPAVDPSALMRYYDKRDPFPGTHITSPADLAEWECGRCLHGVHTDDGIPCDVFVWGAGEPPGPRLTRLGGVPWMPKRIDWPDIAGAPGQFLCQFNFQDSRDIVDEIPDDLLLVFVADASHILSLGVDRMRFVWVSSDESDVISAEDVPTSPESPHIHTWGVRHRAVDLPNFRTRFGNLDELTDEEFEESELADLTELCVLWGTKIGGIPYDSQDKHEQAPDDYLCQLVSVQPNRREPWPWCDRESPMQWSKGTPRSEHEFMIGDLGEISFFLRPDGTVDIHSSCA